MPFDLENLKKFTLISDAREIIDTRKNVKIVVKVLTWMPEGWSSLNFKAFFNKMGFLNGRSLSLFLLFTVVLNRLIVHGYLLNFLLHHNGMAIFSQYKHLISLIKLSKKKAKRN